MRIAVVGGGTAGFIAAAHVTRSLPEAELLHVFDSSIPTIGVGEGTTPRFPVWLEEVTGRTTVPQIFIDGKSVGGYDDIAELERSGELDKLLAGAAR